ncbi:MAG TPA: hypothetical protein VF838_14365 [Trebonia sp.]
MADQASGTVEGTGTGGSNAGLVHGAGGHLEHNPGRPISWVGTSVVIVGFIIGGFAMVPGPHWLVFWIGAAVAIFGCLILLFSRAMSTDWY